MVLVRRLGTAESERWPIARQGLALLEVSEIGFGVRSTGHNLFLAIKVNKSESGLLLQD